MPLQTPGSVFRWSVTKCVILMGTFAFIHRPSLSLAAQGVCEAEDPPSESVPSSEKLHSSGEWTAFSFQDREQVHRENEGAHLGAMIYFHFGYNERFRLRRS